MLEDLPSRIRNGNVVISVVGLGRVGLPLAVAFAHRGLFVIGVDKNEDAVSSVSRGKAPFHYPEIEQWLGDAISRGRLRVTLSVAEAVKQSDVVVVTVGTPTGSQFQLDYSQIQSAFRDLARAGLKDKAVIVRSTSVPGTLVGIILPLLMKETGLKPETDFALAVCPERILEGQAHRELFVLPEIIGGVGNLSSNIASELFRKLGNDKEVVLLTPTGAELAKLFTNIYRYVNFALANEFAIWAERYDEDAGSIIQAANRDYSRSRIPMPGFAGGPCLGKDGLLLDNNTTFSSIVSVAWKLNEAIPQHVVSSIAREIGSLYGRKIAVLGLAFKSESDDVRLSPSAKLVEILEAYGARVCVHDPYIKATASLEETLDSPEVVVLATNHSAFRHLAPLIDKSGCKLVYDVWRVFDPKSFQSAKYASFGKAR